LQPSLVVVGGACHREAGKNTAQVLVGLDAAGRGRFDEQLQVGAGFDPVNGITEERVFFSRRLLANNSARFFRRRLSGVRLHALTGGAVVIEAIRLEEVEVPRGGGAARMRGDSLVYSGTWFVGVVDARGAPVV
jgi:hypothetical protein